jgi:hypothetical protein
MDTNPLMSSLVNSVLTVLPQVIAGEISAFWMILLGADP